MSSSRLARALVSGLALSFLTTPAAFADDQTTTESTRTTETTTTDPWAETPRTFALRVRVAHSRAVARRWSALMGNPMPVVRRPTIEFESLLGRRRWWAHRWARKAHRARSYGRRPPHLRAWLCIHAFEGSWHDPNAPYYGGLQMDLTFQRRYGLRLLRQKGTADHWTRWEQMWVAEHAHRSGRGFYPWPTTARYCGLI
jgi:hypothetical protein